MAYGHSEVKIFSIAEGLGNTELLCCNIAGRLFPIAQSLFHTAAQFGDTEDAYGSSEEHLFPP